MELLRRSQELTPDAIRIVLTAYTDVDNLMEAINTGRIYHFVPKPWDPNELLVVVRRAAERWRLAQENARLRDELEVAYNALRRDTAAGREKPTSFDGLVGADTGLRPAVELARKILDGDTTVLLLGETGTGKELFSHLIHVNGPRRAKPFVAQSCGALPDTLLESELFGHTGGPSPGPPANARGSSRRPTAAPSSSTRSARLPPPCSFGSCGCCRKARCGGSEAGRLATSISA